MLKKFLIGTIATLAFVVAFAATQASADCSITTTLKVGSKGAEVSCLQTKVGATADGSFGPMTKASVMAYQASHGLSADGVVGPLSRAVLNGAVSGNFPVGCLSASGFSSITGLACVAIPSSTAGCTSGAAFSSTTGLSCTSVIAGCSAGAAFSSTTGASCTTGVVTTTTGVSGVGTVDEYKLLTSPTNNREVGMGESDVKVMGFSIKADVNSDLRVSSVKLNFSRSGAVVDFKKVASDVSIWMGTTKLATVVGTEFTSDNSYDKTIAFATPAVVGAGKVVDFYITVSGLEVIDSTNLNDGWTIDVDSVRYTDGTGAIMTDDTSTDFAARTFTFQSLATAADLTLKLTENTGNPVAQVVEVSTTSATDNVLLFKGNLKATNGPVTVKELTMNVTSTGSGDLADIASEYILKINGVEVDSIASSSCFQPNTTTAGTTLCDASGTAATGDYLFDAVDTTIPANSTYTVEILANVNTRASGFVEGDALAVTIDLGTDADVIAWDSAENVLAAGIKSGIVTGNAQTFRSTGVSVVMGATTYEIVTDGASTVQVTYTIPLTVTAFGDTRYMGLAAEYQAVYTDVSDAKAFTFALNDSTDPSIDIVAGGTLVTSSTLTTSDAVSDGTSFRLDEGTARHFTLQVIETAPSTASRSYRVHVEGLQTNSAANLANGTELKQLLTPTQSFQTGYKFITN